VEDEDENTVGIFNSRLLRPHREAKLKPVARINMISIERGIKEPQRLEIEEFCRNLKRKAEFDKKKEKVNILTEKSKDLSKEPEESGVQEVQQPGAAEDDGADDNIMNSSEERNLKRKRSGQISEKGMRHIIRISRFISNKEKEITIDGLVNNIPLKLLPDFRGEFNVITRKALEIIEKENGKLRRIYNTKSIPSYLRNERKVKFKAVGLNIEVRFEKTYEEAVVIQHDKPYIIVGRHVCKKLGLKSKAQEKSDNFELTKWNKKYSAAKM